MYANDLNAVLWMLRETHNDWRVYIELPGDHSYTDDDSWVAQLSVANGNVFTCQIRSRVDGRLLQSGSKALQWLENLRHFTYRLETATIRPAFVQDSPEANLKRIPQRMIFIKKEAIEALPRKQKQIFKLVDGKRTDKQIAAILQQPLDGVEEVLNALHAMEIIRL